MEEGDSWTSRSFKYLSSVVMAVLVKQSRELLEKDFFFGRMGRGGYMSFKKY
jgi:hypothetical protein